MVTSRPRPQKPWQKKSQTPSVLDALAEQEERIAARLRKLRADIGHPERPGHALPVDQAAARAEVNYRQWQRWEAGDTMPHSKNLERVAEAFGVDVAEFYATDEPQEETQLDRIEQMLTEIRDHLLGAPAEQAPAVAGVADRLLQAASSPPSKAGAQRGKSPAATRRKTA